MYIGTYPGGGADVLSIIYYMYTMHTERDLKKFTKEGKKGKILCMKFLCFKHKNMILKHNENLEMEIEGCSRFSFPCNWV